MGAFIDLTGQKFGRLTVIKRSYPNTKWEVAKFLCRCKCGKEIITTGSSLRGGLTKSCGCLHQEYMKSGHARRMKFGLANMRALMGKYKGGARKRGFDFNLTERQFEKLTKERCYYCGIKPNSTQNDKGSNGKYIYNGIDRVDNNKGYTIDNVVSCCMFCNMAKNNRTLQEFKNWVEKIYNNMYGIS